MQSFSSQPPPAVIRLPPRKPVVVWLFLGLNVAVFLAWQAARSVEALRPLMAGTFLVSTAHLREGLWWTVLTAEFSHLELWHLLLNMIVLVSFGSLLERLWGWRLFTGFYLVAAVVASLAHCAVSSWLMGRPDVYALGASGALSGVLMAYALQFPRHRILIFGIVPVPALIAALAFVALDIWGLVAQGRGGGLPIGHGAHLGGALCGLLLWIGVLRERFPRAEVEGRGPMVELTVEESAELDRLHRLLREQGPEALTPKERHFLLELRMRIARAEEIQPPRS